MNRDHLTIGLAQIAPVWLDKNATLEKVADYVSQAATQSVDLVVFGEALLPGYPFWIELTEGAQFESSVQKSMNSIYMRNAVQIESGDLDTLCILAKDHSIAIYLGIIERAHDRGGHSQYCSLVYIDNAGSIQSVHRKLMPTYEERLFWSTGDGHGLRVHTLGHFTVGGLNCWENWMPLPRAALYGMGEDCHVAVWPGNVRNTEDITRFIAREARSYVISVSSIMRRGDIPDDLPISAQMRANLVGDYLADGGSCVCGPDGQWVLAPQQGDEALYICEINHELVRRERHNFDPAGHYSRPDVTQLQVDRRRQATVAIIDNEAHDSNDHDSDAQLSD